MVLAGARCPQKRGTIFSGGASRYSPDRMHHRHIPAGCGGDCRAPECYDTRRGVVVVMSNGGVGGEVGEVDPSAVALSACALSWRDIR